MPKFTRAALGSPRLAVSLRHRLGSCALDVAFNLTQPWTILFGPSGSGKSTLLRAIAGLVVPDSARIVWTLPPGDDAANGFTAALTLVDTAERLCLPANERQIPIAPQTPSLFPHLTVRQNILYGLARASSAAPADPGDFLTLFHLTALADKAPAALSGGEAQRVNLARAAAAATPGGLLLLDEPFTGLDHALRTDLLHDLRTWAPARDVAVLSVTHDIAEAFELNAEVLKLSGGRIVQQGPVAEVLAAERTRLLTQLGADRG